MSALKDQLRADMTASMKAGDKDRTGTLRLLMAAVMAEEKAGDTAVELDDAGVQAVLKRQLKQRTESIEALPGRRPRGTGGRRRG